VIFFFTADYPTQGLKVARQILSLSLSHTHPNSVIKDLLTHTLSVLEKQPEAGNT
jgi:hypothetical protein